MKAITICQPYAHLIVVDRSKRVENRTWETHYRGDLLIHAGKSRSWLPGGIDIVETYVPHGRAGYCGRKLISTADIQGREIVFGAIIGVAKLIDCLHIDEIEACLHDEKFPWLREHHHTEGPWCWILGDVLQLPTPFAYSGKQGLFNVKFDERKGVCSQCGCTWHRACPGSCHWVAPNLCSSCVEAHHE